MYLTDLKDKCTFYNVKLSFCVWLGYLAPFKDVAEYTIHFESFLRVPCMAVLMIPIKPGVNINISFLKYDL
jgi:hypothetical protein